MKKNYLSPEVVVTAITFEGNFLNSERSTQSHDPDMTMEDYSDITWTY